MKKDEVFAVKQTKIGPFQFDDQVAKVFDDMVSRSVPGYADHLLLQSKIAQKYLKDDCVVIDIGCSTGNSLFPLFSSEKHIQFIGIDPSSAMIDQFQTKLSFVKQKPNIQLVQANAQSLELPSADIVFLNYTLQFIIPEDRAKLLDKIFEALKPGGILLFSEKMQNPGTFISELEVEFYYDYKRQNGYSELEISQKRDALEEVLIPDSLELHLARLKEAGFNEVGLWHKWFNFGSFIAIKQGLL
tara:strand:+ start:107 stop:838 length:732 start_codon:yes stop_codon:yes gene_type:complete